MRRKHLSKQEVKNAIDGKSSPRHVPVTFSIWPPPSYKSSDIFKSSDTFRSYKSFLKYRGDIRVKYMKQLMRPIIKFQNSVTLFDKPKTEGPLDEDVYLEDYANLDEFLEQINDPYKIKLSKTGGSKRYKLTLFWNGLFENLWQIRGMKNALMDPYLYPEEVHRVFRAITDFYKVLIIRAKTEQNSDGFMGSDDLGHQTAAFFSSSIFKEFYYPYYKELIDTAHEYNMHYWLHACGDITQFLPMFIEMGLDVIHPLQKYAMDEVKVFEEFHDQICFLYGFDVQQILPFGTVNDVKQEVYKTFDLFTQAKGRFIFTTGNGITNNCPVENYETLLKEAREYNPYKES